jgi:hypothetical protein
MRKRKLLFIVFTASVVMSCDVRDDELLLDAVSGFVHKGPYLNGSSITLFELSPELRQTGSTYASQIHNNTGNFEIKGIKLSSQYVELRANGFYYNEIRNENSPAQLTLYALSDVSEKSTLNVNILSTLEKSRVEHLIVNGASFSSAKTQAQSEILKIFEIFEMDIMDSDLLDITKSGDDHAILLAISVIMQGYLTVSELSELISNIGTDIREDGVLNDPELGSILINNARAVNQNDIRANLESRYNTQETNILIPEFEKYIIQFVESTSFEFTGFIKYPATGNYGNNILDRYQTEYPSGDCSMAAVLPEGTSLKVKIQGTNWFYSISQDWSCWEKSDWNDTENSRYFTSKKTGELDFKLRLEVDADTTGSVSDTSDTQYAKTKIFVYENGVMEPTWTKEITVK